MTAQTSGVANTGDRKSKKWVGKDGLRGADLLRSLILKPSHDLVNLLADLLVRVLA